MIPRLDIQFDLHNQYQYWFGKHPYIPQQGEYLLNHARSGIVMLLHTMLPKGGKVGMMTYNCHTVMNAIEQAGCQPVFIDVDENLRIDLTSLQQKSTQLDALIITHLFGIENDMMTIRAICPTLYIIEDCAHGWGINMCPKSDGVVYSINQGKFPSIGEGGILKVNKRWQAKINQIYESLPTYTFGQKIKLYNSMIIKALLYKPLLYTYFTLPVLKKNKDIVHIHQSIVLKKMYKGVQRILGEDEKLINARIQDQRKNAEVWKEQLKNILDVNNYFYGQNAFMLVCECIDIVTVQKWLMQQGVETETHFKHCIDWAKTFGYKEGDCPMTEKLTKKLLMIPTYKFI
ncbi:MAG: DegT/DnrJ/EryC1/StrS family aminotransferase [Paludibacteraceae bacterium]|nr:DegT/DnrJ/EryC1/StrS family aminotransferase [Paludibacteraceae bacterium]